MSENKGFERVATMPRKRGRFSSPNPEPMAKPISLRLPKSLDEWVKNEASRQGLSKIDLIRIALAAQRESLKSL